jgi:alanine racemase
VGYIEVSKKAFFHNLDYFASICDKDKLSIALKDNAYGHGIEQIATLASQYGIKNVFVRTIDEAKTVERFGFEQVLVLYDIPKELDKNIIISINSIEHIEKIPNNSIVELKIDTSMNRNGIDTCNIQEAIALINKKDLILNGVFTHFCCADEDNEITKIQEQTFLDAVGIVKQYIKYDFKIHCANSAGIHKVNMDLYDMARIGIGVYGYLDLGCEQYLKPVLKLIANKINTKTIYKDQHIGYGSCAFVASKKMTVSNYDIGYGDGFFRIDENKNYFLPNIEKKILGRISMDSFTIECEDNSVVVFDNVTDLAKLHSTIKYEILTNLKANIPRYIV